MKEFRITLENSIRDRYSYVIEADKEDERKLPLGKWKGRPCQFKGVEASTFIDNPGGANIDVLVDEFLESEYCPITFEDHPPITFVTIEREWIES